MQRSHTSLGTDLVAVARGCGFAHAEAMAQIEAVGPLAARVRSRQGCLLAQVRVACEEVPKALPARDAVYLKNRFRAALDLPPF